MKIVIIGSLNIDTTLTVEKLPEKGETLFAKNLYNSFGGKGANQAVACSRLGGEVEMAGYVGSDSNGQEYIEKLQLENVKTKLIYKTKETHTGMASITVQEDGSNTIVVYPGANFCVTKKYILQIFDSIKDVDLIIIQFEIPMETIEYIGTLARNIGAKLIVNPAPANKISEEFISSIDYFTPNETELKLLTGLEDREEAVKYLLEKGVKNLIVTLGAKGSCWYTPKDQTYVDAFSVNSIDTTAAGDCFNGAFAIGLDKFDSKEEILRFANAAAGLSTTKAGAIDSLPTYQEVMDFLAEYN